MASLGVICARGTESWAKNIALLNGKPLIWYAIHTAKQSRLDRVIVSTNDAQIAKVARDCGGDVPFSRPKELATPASKIERALVHALKFCESADKKRYDIVVCLQNSSPLRLPSDIDCCISKIEDGYSCAMTVHKVIHNHPDLCCYLLDNTIKLIRKSAPFRRQDREEVYAVNGLVFAIKRDLLIETERVIQDGSAYCVVPDYRAIDIHDELDLEIASLILKHMEKTQCQECC